MSKKTVELVSDILGGKAAPAAWVLSVAADGHSILTDLDGNGGKIKNETSLGAVSARRAVLNDERRGLIYSMRVKMDKASINVDGTPVSLSPGMAVSVEIKTGKRRVIEYFLSPLMQHADESLRER